jgi:RNA recognition motif-containing protein
MNINILKLSRKTTHGELVKLFQEYGEVESCHIVMDRQSGESKGFGFIKMPNDDEANDAIKNLHDTKFGGSKIKVKASDKIS